MRCLAILLLVAAAPVHATIINGTFDEGLDGWSSIGSRGFTLGGQGGIRTYEDAVDGVSDPSARFPSARDVSAALGLPLLAHPLGYSVLLTPFDAARTDGLLQCTTGDGDDCFTGGAAAIWQSMSVTDPRTEISLDYNFFTLDGPSVGDAGFFFLIEDESNYQVISLGSSADLLPYTASFPTVLGPDIGSMTGPSRFSFRADPGNYLVGFAVFHGGDMEAGSALFFDNVRAHLVPEPPALGLAALGLVSVIISVARRRRAIRVAN